MIFMSKCPIGARFGFGGRLFSFRKPVAKAAANSPQQQQQQPQKSSYSVLISEIVTDKQITAQAESLIQISEPEQAKKFCEEKVTFYSQIQLKTKRFFQKFRFQFVKKKKKDCKCER